MLMPASAKAPVETFPLPSAHPLTPPNRPHNSLYVISDSGAVVDRYDKQYLSHTELTTFYTPGFRSVVVEVVDSGSVVVVVGR